MFLNVFLYLLQVYSSPYDKFPSSFVLQGCWQVYYKNFLLKWNWEKVLLIWIGKGLFNSLPSASVKPVNLEKTWKQKRNYWKIFLVE